MTPTSGACKILFLCTGNSARSILAEALLNHLAGERFVGFSAGCRPARAVNRYALELLQQHGIPVEPLYCKSWREFAAPGTLTMDCIIVLSGNLAREPHPHWHGRPLTAPWYLRDPAAVTGTAAKKRRAFEQTFGILQCRIQQLVALPAERLESRRLRQELQLIADRAAAPEW